MVLGRFRPVKFGVKMTEVVGGWGGSHFIRRAQRTNAVRLESIPFDKSPLYR
jgi:hypothetical protein